MSLTPADRTVALAHDGEEAHSPVRLVVSPSAGRFLPLIAEIQPRPGDMILAGQPIGVVEMSRDHIEVRSAFSGVLVGMLAVEGQRVRPEQPVAWLQLHSPEVGVA